MVNIRVMAAADYDEVYNLWINVPGMGLNTTDDSREGIQKYLERNLATSFVVECYGKIIGAVMAGNDKKKRVYLSHCCFARLQKPGGGSKTGCPCDVCAGKRGHP